MVLQKSYPAQSVGNYAKEAQSPGTPMGRQRTFETMREGAGMASPSPGGSRRMQPRSPGWGQTHALGLGQVEPVSPGLVATTNARLEGSLLSFKEGAVQHQASHQPLPIYQRPAGAALSQRAGNGGGL
jgi:hypothetical protein